MINFAFSVRMILSCLFVAAVLTATLSGWPAVARAETPILVQSTTSTQNSGLYGHLLPLYKEASGRDVRVVAVGTGQAINNARNCDGDVLLVHSKDDEEAFVADGYGIERHDLMYNDFVLIGPADDPAGVRGSTTITTALEALAGAKAKFVSRGDDSGTHKAERRFWKTTSYDPAEASGTWYIETGQGMGGTLNVAVQIKGYVISDRSTWVAFNNKAGHRIVFEGDPRIFNQYGLIVISPEKCPQVRLEGAQHFADWLISPAGQQAINSYTVRGQQLFFANAGK
ncbi:MAG: substrate-binding domain-containing protein [Candidatus Puniceispirillales bacterium]